MKDWTSSFLLALVFTTGSAVEAQTLEESKAALVRDDYRTAFAGFKKAAAQGNAEAQFSLGWMYGAGEGVVKDDQQAVMWYRKAAEQGHVVAQHNLGAMYSGGRGVPQDEQQAIS